MASAAAPRRHGAAASGRTQLGRLIALLVPLGLLGGALGSQYVGGLQPCEMCYWQRWPHAVAIGLAALAFTDSAGSRRSRTLTLLAAVAIAVSGAIGAYHAGVELKIFEGLTSCATTAGAASNAELLDQLMRVPLVRCDQVQWSLLGISMAGWNAIISLGAAATVAVLTLARRPR